jgi:hypothetical protein
MQGGLISGWSGEQCVAVDFSRDGQAVEPGSPPVSKVSLDANLVQRGLVTSRCRWACFTQFCASCIPPCGAFSGRRVRSSGLSHCRCECGEVSSPDMGVDVGICAGEVCPGNAHARLIQVQLRCPFDGCPAAGDVKPGVDALGMGADSAQGDHELTGDLQSRKLGCCTPPF